MLVLTFLLLVLAGSVSAEVYFYPNDNVVAICNVTTLTCVTNTGLLTWSTSIEKHGKTFITSSGLNTVSELGEHITVQLTNKDGSILTSVATITGSNSTLNEAMISCGDTRGTVRSKTLFIPVLSELGFKPLNFTSATFYWAIWPSVNPECVHNYTVLVQSDVHTLGILHNITTATTSLNVTGLIRGEEYTVTVSTAHSCETILITLEVPEAVTDLRINQLDNGINVSWKQPQSSRPPVLSYIIQHNITDNSSNLTELTTNTTIHGVLQTGHVYYIQVTPVNVLGPGTVGKTILTVAQSLPTTTSVNETTDLPTTAGVLIIVSILCVTLMLFGFCLVVAILILKRKKQKSSNSATQQKQPPKRNALHIYETLEQENHLYFIESQELPNSLSLSFPPPPPPPPPLPASIQPVSLPLQAPSPPPPLPPPLSLSPSPSPPPPSGSSLPATKPLPMAQPMIPPPSSRPPSPPPSPGSEAAVLHEYDKPLPVTRSRPGTVRK